MMLVKDVVLEQSVAVYQRRGWSAYGRPLHGSGGESSPRSPWIGLRQIQDVEIGSSFCWPQSMWFPSRSDVTEVIRGNQPVLSLVGLPIPL